MSEPNEPKKNDSGRARLRLAEPHLAAALASGAPEAPAGAERASTGPLTAGHFMTDFYPGLMPGLWPEVGKNLALSEAAATTLPAIGSALMVLQPFIGLWADRLGARRRFIVTGLVVAACLYPLLLLMPSYALTVACLVPAALGIATFHPVAAGAAKRGGAAALSLFVGLGTAGYVTGQLAGPAVVQAFGAEWLILLAIPGLAAALWIQGTERPGARPPPPSLQLLWGDLCARWRPVAVLWAIVALRAFAIMAFVRLLPFFLDERRGLAPLPRSIPGTILILACAIGGLFAAWLMRRLGARFSILLSFALGMPLLAVGAWAVSLGGGALGAWDLASYGLTFVGGAVMGSTVPVNIALAQRLLPRSAALASGVMMGLGWSVGGVLVPLGSLLGGAMGNTAHAVAVLVAATALSGALALLLPRDDDAAAEG